MMYKYETLVFRFNHRYPDSFDDSDLEACPDIKHWFITTDARVKVEGPMGIRFGRISTTTGWKPGWLLMHRITDHGSWDLLSPDDRVIAVQVRGQYRPVEGRSLATR
jgi:hypothetical protein